MLDLSKTSISALSGSSGCSNLSCVVTDCIVDTTCDWECAADQQTSSFPDFLTLFASGKSCVDKTGERIFDTEDSCDVAFGPIPPEVSNVYWIKAKLQEPVVSFQAKI
jgi:hypothetical protein